MKKYIVYALMVAGLLCCSNGIEEPVEDLDPQHPDPPGPNPNEVIYDETGCLYTSYKGLVMCGYQGWYSAEGDGLDRGWYHYEKNGILEPENIAIECWPDVSEYERTYAAPGFKFADGQQAYLYSAQDESTVDAHFRWMKEYGIDGVFMQRFVSQTKDKGKIQFNKVLTHALKAAKKYDRAICIMYDGHIGNQNDYEAVTKDWNELVETFKLFDPEENPTFLRHNGKPVFSFWGAGLSNRRFDATYFEKMCEEVKGSEAKKTTIMLGMPYYWRENGSDCINDPQFLPMIKEWCDIIMPWSVGRYRGDIVESRVKAYVRDDIAWCKANNIDYVPVVFPGFSWENLMSGSPFDEIPRDRGNFLWRQVSSAKNAGAEMLYVAMFDEMDEATCIFKCATTSELPLNGNGRFLGYDDDLGSDYYLWLTGQAAEWFHGKPGFSEQLPQRIENY